MEELDKYTFLVWAKKVLKRIDELEKEVKQYALQQQFADIKLLDNQDLCMLLKVDRRTLQRYRKDKLIKSFNIKGKNYYKASDIRKFINEQ